MPVCSICRNAQNEAPNTNTISAAIAASDATVLEFSFKEYFPSVSDHIPHHRAAATCLAAPGLTAGITRLLYTPLVHHYVRWRA